jgi:hypothetical protein
MFPFTAFGLRVDQVQMQNGDRYAGKVVSMTANALVLQSDMLGSGRTLGFPSRYT